MTKLHRNMPRRQTIAKYWSSRHEKVSEDDANHCFACGDGLRIERCHIVPKHQGGTDDVSNLHLLCAACHVESENLTGSVYWAWFDRKPWHHHYFHIAKRLALVGADAAWQLYGSTLSVRMSREQFDREWHKIASIGGSR